MKVIREQLIEAAKTYTDFESKYNISAFNEDDFFWSVFFTLFLRLQIYEAIAAIFWQSAIYVLSWSISWPIFPLIWTVFLLLWLLAIGEEQWLAENRLLRKVNMLWQQWLNAAGKN